MVGLTTAKAIALAAGKPLIADQSSRSACAHGAADRRLDFPYLLLLVSGGHTQLLAVEGVGDYALLGTTIDDASAKLSTRPPSCSGSPIRADRRSRRRRDGQSGAVRFAAPAAGTRRGRFLLFGPEDRLALEAEKIAPLERPGRRRSLRIVPAGRGGRGGRPASRRASHFPGSGLARRPRSLPPAASPPIRRSEKSCTGFRFESGTVLVVPPPALCTDNGAMIAWAGVERLALGLVDPLELAPRARWPLEDIADASR